MNVPRTSVRFGDDVVQALHDLGFLVAIETNGRLLVPAGAVTGFAAANRAALAIARGHELKIRVAAAVCRRFDERARTISASAHRRPWRRRPHAAGRRATPDSSEMANQRAMSQTSRHQMKISQVFKFEAAHRLPTVPQTHRCHRTHGHSYRVEVVLNGPVDPHTGFVMDFFSMEEAFGLLLKKLDHHCLNEVPGLENPTAENIAIWIWQHAKPRLAQLSSVRVYETTDCWAEYEGPDR